MRLAIVILAVTITLASPVLASESDPRYDIGVAFLIDLPQEDFANISGTGGGIGIKFLRPIGLSLARLRGDFEILFYGEDEHVVEIGGKPAGVITRHESIRIQGGFELSSPRSRSLRLYVAPMAGFYLFRSVDRVTIYHHRSSTDTEFGWKVDAGFVITRFVRRHRPHGLGIDFGVSYGTVRNAVKTKVETDIETESKTFETDANEFIIHAGLIWHIR
ncbi:MAG: hypothetical protein KAW17_08105 [Candidatus Eisenbacteria sp.]|nr:hypothetical protein [Candidatus Eisenbacteria bacterium]